MNVFFIKIKRNVFPIIILLFSFSLLVFSKNNIIAIKSSLKLWSTSIVPSLFPFFVSTELLINTNIAMLLEKFLSMYMKPVFNINGSGSFAFIMGIISGYPMGAKITCNLRKNNICSKEECERLLSFTNNSSPLFIIGTIGISCFKSSTIGVLLFISHITSSILVGIIFRFWKKNKKIKYNTKTIKKTYSQNINVNLSNLGEILSKSVTNAISTILLIRRICSYFFLHNINIENK